MAPDLGAGQRRPLWIGHFDALAKALETVLEEDVWRWRPDTEEVQKYEADEFEIFLTAPPTKGCGVELDGLIAVLRARHRGDLERRVRMLTSREISPHGTNQWSGMVTPTPNSRPTRPLTCSPGCSEIGRISPEVATGALSPHAAAIRAGIRHQYARVRTDDADRAIAVLLDHYSRDDLMAALMALKDRA